MTPERKAELETLLGQMQRVSDSFYWQAFKLNNHPFIEFCGLMNEYINLCKDSLAQGIDYTQTSVHAGARLVVEPFRLAYLTEKLSCIFGPSLDKNQALELALGIAHE